MLVSGFLWMCPNQLSLCDRLIEILATIYLAELRKTTKNLNQGTDVRVEFGTGYFPSKNILCCRYTSLIGVAG